MPIGTYQDDYKDLLNKLEDEEIIKSYTDNSTEDGFDFEVIVPRTTGYMDHDTIMKTFKLISRDTENYTYWGYDDKIKVANSVQDIINYFVAYRLQKYEDRRLKQIDNLNAELSWANEKLRFIKFYLKNSGDFAKKGKAELHELLTKNKFNEIEKLLQIRIYSLTKDEIDKLEKEITEIAIAIKELQSITNLDLYVKELKELKF